MKRLIALTLVSVSSLFSINASADQVYVDILKSNQFNIEDVQPIIDQSSAKLEAVKKDFLEGRNNEGEKVYAPIVKKIKAVINKKGQFAYLKLNYTVHPGDANQYLLINVVDQSDAASIKKYDANPKGHYNDPGHLIRDWRQYEKVAIPLYLSGKVSSNTANCKEFHCLGSFDSPKLKKYEIEFNREVPRYQSQLVEILNNDADASKRATVVFLLGHTTNQAQLINWLLPALNDADENVRNNAARVFAVMATKDKNITLPVNTFIDMLHSPIATDKNKSMMVLWGLSSQPRYADVIKKEAGADLMECLRLNEPNLHQTAYVILATMSHQNYPERDYTAWSHWLGLA